MPLTAMFVLALLLVAVILGVLFQIERRRSHKHAH